MGKPLSSLTLRLISSAVLIPVVVSLVAIGEWFFIGLIAICIAIAFIEWINITKHIPISRHTKSTIIIVGFFYLGFSFIEMSLLREHSNGLFWTILFMMCIWASDSVAYLFGKTMGGPKMSPTISPNKTWSGYMGALIGPAIFLFLAVHVATPDFLIERTPEGWITLLTGLCFGVAGQAGDLMISAMKRKAGLKDTGAIIPGHGGILDRIDALLLALPIFLAYIKFVTG